MTLDLVDLAAKFQTKLRIVGNIPYHLTSEILFKIFEEREGVRDLTMMIQKEVARRIVAQPSTKEYGILAVFSQFYGIPKLLFNVSPNCFYPKPKVNSTVVTIALRETVPDGFDLAVFGAIVRTAFMRRRKTLRNSLSYLDYPEDRLEAFFSRIPEYISLRPEQLHIEQFIILTKRFSETE